MTHNIASIQPCGEFHIGGSTTANEADVRAAISRLPRSTRTQVYAALANDGAGIDDLPASVLREARDAIYSVLILNH